MPVHEPFLIGETPNSHSGGGAPTPYIPATMNPPAQRGNGPPRPSPARTIAAALIIVVTAVVAYYAVDARQRSRRLEAEIVRLHEVQALLRDSLAAARTTPRAATAPPASPRP